MSAPVRPRDAEATRRALLEAARSLFSRDGYDATTVRAIADRAGVNQALLFRYFGNKEGIFAEAVRGRALALLAEAPRDELLARLVRGVLRPAGPQDMFLAVLRGSISSTAVGAQLRAEIGAAYTAAIADLVHGSDRADAETRARLLLAWILGISLMRTAEEASVPIPADTALPHVLRAAEALLHG